MPAPNQFGFGRELRLTRPAEFQSVFARARRSADRLFTVLYRDSGRSTARIGFALAKKRIPAAVARNRVRRIARESFRHHRDTLGGLDIIILGQPAAAKAGNSELFASLTQHWRKLQNRQDDGRGRRRRKDAN